MAMMAMTTSSSISVNADRDRERVERIQYLDEEEGDCR
jgi:hypothetical protein